MQSYANKLEVIPVKNNRIVLEYYSLRENDRHVSGWIRRDTNKVVVLHNPAQDRVSFFADIALKVAKQDLKHLFKDFKIEVTFPAGLHIITAKEL